jgi:hypothetical protein
MTDLVGVVKQLQVQRNAIEQQLSKVTAAVEALRGMSGKGTGTMASSRSPRVMSASARRRIAAAQKARWAKWRKGQKVVPITRKRTMSAAARRKIAAAQRARWARVRAEK